MRKWKGGRLPDPPVLVDLEPLHVSTCAARGSPFLPVGPYRLSLPKRALGVGLAALPWELASGR